MKTARHIGLGFVGGVALAGCLVGAASAQDSELVGTWDCSGSVQDAEIGMTMNAEFEQTFSANGTYSRTATISMAIAAMQIEFGFDMDEQGNWEREGMTLHETPTALEIVSTSEMPSPIEQMALGQMQAEAQASLNTATSSAITSLTSSAMTLDGDDDFGLSCQKA